MPLTLEPEGDLDPIRAEEHDPEDAQELALGDPEEADESPHGEDGEEEGDEAE